MPLRQPIVCMLGHIDAGKTSILDRIRHSRVQLREVGGITQHIGVSFIPLQVLIDICKPLLKRFNIRIELPGVIVIDTPGHESFFNLRLRGGSIADIAILVVDILKGLQEQTYECINILKQRKTPFIVAANKLDKVPGWESRNMAFIDNLRRQGSEAERILDDYIYRIVGQLGELGFSSERYDRISDFTRNVAIIPTSAKTGEGIQDLILVLLGLLQQYMKRKLEASVEGPGEGVVLEVKEVTGLGTVIDGILVNGIVKKGDRIVVGSKDGVIVTKIRALLIPKPLDEIRDPTKPFDAKNEVAAASGVRIVAPNLENALSGSPFFIAYSDEDIEKYKEKILSEIGQIRFSTDKVGVVLKADTLGSLEALTSYFRKQTGVPVRVADIGDISKRDIIQASIVKKDNPEYGVVIGFNVSVLEDAREEAAKLGVPILTGNLIYKIVESYEEWRIRQRKKTVEEILKKLPSPGKIKVLPQYIFRRSKPAIVGVEVLSGKIKPRIELMLENGKKVGMIMQIQDKGQAIPYAVKGQEVAISIKGGVIGRNIKPPCILYTYIPEHLIYELLNFKNFLSEDELETLKEIKRIILSKKLRELGEYA